MVAEANESTKSLKRKLDPALRVERRDAERRREIGEVEEGVCDEGSRRMEGDRVIQSNPLVTVAWVNHQLMSLNRTQSLFFV